VNKQIDSGGGIQFVFPVAALEIISAGINPAQSIVVLFLRKEEAGTIVGLNRA
jgi:hypothetical protein